jgi:hypothetical protein
LPIYCNGYQDRKCLLFLFTRNSKQATRTTSKLLLLVKRKKSLLDYLEINKAKHRQANGTKPSMTYSKAPVQERKQDVQESFGIVEKQLSSLLYQLLKPEYGVDYINPEVIKEAKKRGKRPTIQVSR